MYNLSGDCMKIEKIKKMSNGKYKIEFDNNEKIVTYDDIILKNSLLYKNELTLQELNEINKDNSYYDIYNKTINYITKRLRSEKKIDTFLDKFELEDEKKNKIKNELRKINLIDDIKFASSYISDRIHLSNDGSEKIKTSLFNYGIDSNIIESEINKIDDEVILDKLNKMIKKKVVNNHRYSLYILKQKLIVELINLGYKREMIVECLEQYTNTNNNIEKEYDRQYNKLSKKYEDDKLYYQLKQKLYQKGYSKEEIEEVIQKKEL